jgi:Xaa-Pro aminopeptidase
MQMNTPRWYDQKKEKGMTQMDLGLVPLLSLKERDRRWNELRKRMFIRGIDAVVFFGSDAGFGRGMSHFRYITHYADAHGGWAIFPLQGECSIFSGPMHMNLPYSRFRILQNWVTDLRPDCGAAGIVKELKERGLDKSRIGIVSYGGTGVSSEIMPYALLTKLMKDLPDATFIDTNPIITEMRIIKSKEELEFLYKAGQIARKRIDVMIDSVKVGNTEADIYANMIASDIKNGGEPQLFLLMATGNLYEDDPGIKCLLHGGCQPSSPTMRKLKDGDLAICEFHTQYGGYMAGCEFSLFLGEPPKELREIQKASMEAITNAVATIKPGTTMREAWTAIRKPAIDRGLDFIELGFHGHGLASPEYPGSVYREEDDPAVAIADVPFEEDMIICLNIDIHNSNWRKDVGMMYGDMLHITKNGAKQLIGIPTEFICNKA